MHACSGLLFSDSVVDQLIILFSHQSFRLTIQQVLFLCPSHVPLHRIDDFLSLFLVWVVLVNFIRESLPNSFLLAVLLANIDFRCHLHLLVVTVDWVLKVAEFLLEFRKVTWLLYLLGFRCYLRLCRLEFLFFNLGFLLSLHFINYLVKLSIN